MVRLTQKQWIGVGLGGLALVVLAVGLGSQPSQPSGGDMPVVMDGSVGTPQQAAYDDGSQGTGGQTGGGQMGGGQAEQALQGLIQIRQQQCQMGNSMACQSLQQFPAYQQQLAQLGQSCQSGNQQACGEYQSLAQRILTAYKESTAVMQAGEQGMAQMNAWRGQMNANAANSMANLRAQAARGQAAHEARQETYAGMNRSWQAGQDSAARGQGRYVDGIYGGTTMDGGGSQARIDHGSTGYVDGNGNVIAVPNGGTPPPGYTQMNETYRAR